MILERVLAVLHCGPTILAFLVFLSVALTGLGNALAPIKRPLDGRQLLQELSRGRRESGKVGSIPIPWR